MEVALNYIENYRNIKKEKRENISAKPFLKWAGGKTQLIQEIEKNLPIEIRMGKIKKYVEPFVGSGALFFYLVSKYNFDEIYINDANKELINTYKVIRNDAETLVKELEKLQRQYVFLDEEKRSELFYEIRDLYNHKKTNEILNATYFIFLNRTCFNGLYRVNSKGKFNVPFGKYTNPKICDSENLLNVSKLLKNVKILNVDFEDTEKYIDSDTFVYFDPPYRPLNITSSFNSYSKDEFNDETQKRLSEFYRRLNRSGAKLMLSNSDPKNTNENDNFFDSLYSGFRIERVDAKRMINSNATKRGSIKELLIINDKICIKEVEHVTVVDGEMS